MIKRKKAILFVVEKISGGGVEKIAQIILRNFDYERYDVTLLTVPHQDVSFLAGLPVTFRHIFDYADANDGFFNKLKTLVGNKLKLLVYYHLSPKTFAKLFVRGKYDVAIAFIEGYATRIVAGMNDNVRKLAWLHIDINTHHWTDVAFHSRKEEQEAYKAFNHVACVSKRVEEVAREQLNIDKNISTVYNPIETDLIHAQADDDHPKVFVRPESIKIVSLGTLVPRKGYHTLIPAVNRLIKQGHDIELTILGEGSERERLTNLISSFGIQDSVHLPGFVNNPYPYIKEADIYVCSSDAEGYNTAISEALVLGKAVVATDCCGVKEQLGDNNEFGIRVPVSEEGLYNGLRQMTDPNLRQQYSSAALASASRFKLSENMNEIYRLIEG